ncbi:phosphotransferase enzyme family protein [Pedobacter sp. AW1-32]|uniref:phosphotransferase enzyme family protein n=1 Tax=Pedobacter sp. AW1-32 TaxID=3383026 RepID=UPI003FEFC770
MFQEVLSQYGLHLDQHNAEPHGSGLINFTWKISGKTEYLLQKINKNVFPEPKYIDENLFRLKQHLDLHWPDYPFTAPVSTSSGKTLVQFKGDFYRLFPFISNSKSINFVHCAEEAFQAAKQFGRFSRVLDGFETKTLHYTLPDFHNLPLRVIQFKTALKNASAERIEKARSEINLVTDLFSISERYEEIIKNPDFKLRVIHHDTKINNVLLDKETGAGLRVIDLDTVMPGYYISDVGDMMRTYLSEATEEEQNIEKIDIREDVFEAIYNGYMNEMGNFLTQTEKNEFIYSGKFLIYMQALRFLTDFLNGNIYYQITYPEHNLRRAANQLQLLKVYIAAEPDFEKIINK